MKVSIFHYFCSRLLYEKTKYWHGPQYPSTHQCISQTKINTQSTGTKQQSIEKKNEAEVGGGDKECKLYDGKISIKS